MNTMKFIAVDVAVDIAEDLGDEECTQQHVCGAYILYEWIQNRLYYSN